MRAMVLFAALATGCGGTTPTAEPSVQGVSLAFATLEVEGMTCGACGVTIRVAAMKLDGVESVEVSYDSGSAIVRYDPARIKPEAVAQLITDLGYPTTPVLSKG